MKLGIAGVTACCIATLGTGCLSFHRGPLPGAPKDASYADIDGVRLRYRDEGQGPAVVLLHGFASSLETWETVTPTLKKTHRVLSLDLKGFGWSARPEGDYSPAAQAQLVLGLMRARGIEHADLVAHSWGSSVALATTLADPKRIERIALYDAWVYEDQLPTFFLWARAPGVGETLFALWYGERADERMYHAFFDKKYITESFVEAVDRSLERPGTFAAALAATRGQRFAEVEGKYRTIRNKTLILWGREDEVTLLPFGERLSTELPNAKLVVYPQCGHFPMIEAASASTKELDEFLKAEPAATPPAPSGSEPLPKSEPTP